MNYTARTERGVNPLWIIVPVLIFAWLVIAIFLVLAPALALFLLRYVVLAVVAVIVLQSSAPKAPLWVRMLFLVIIANFVLGHGIANAAVGFGSVRVTVSELTIALTLLYVILCYRNFLWVSWLSGVLLVFALLPLIIHLPLDIWTYGVTAARDAMHWVDSFAFFAGLAVVGAGVRLGLWHSWRHRFLLVLLYAVALYVPLFPIQDILLAYSPQAFGYQQALPLIGSFKTTTMATLAGILAIILMPNAFWHSGKNAPKLLLYVLLVAYGVGFVFIQSRASYITGLFACAVLAFLGRARALWRLIVVAATLIAGLALVDLSGVKMEGRIGTVGLGLLTGQFETVIGSPTIGSPTGIEFQMAGIAERFRWWEYSLQMWAKTPQTILFGIGFGKDLTGSYKTRSIGGEALVITREPHNSTVSVLVRSGLIDCLLWASFQVGLLTVIARRYRSLRRIDPAEANYLLWLGLLFCSLLITSSVETVFEFPYFALPYYFLAGIAIAEAHYEPTSSSGKISVPAPPRSKAES